LLDIYLLRISCHFIKKLHYFDLKKLKKVIDFKEKNQPFQSFSFIELTLLFSYEIACSICDFEP